MQTNTKKTTPPLVTHEGGRAKYISAEDMLKRSVMSNMLFEGDMYEDGATIADRIRTLVPMVDPSTVSDIAITARTSMKLRHVPLLIIREMARLSSHKGLVAYTLSEVIQRPDEITEFLAIYWKDRPDKGRAKLSSQIKKGLAAAFKKFDEYQLAKYNRDLAVKLRDALFLVHPKGTESQQAVWDKLAAGELAAPQTWEVLLSSGKDKKETFETLLSENKLGAMALLRNLRNMEQAGVDPFLIKVAISTMSVSRVLPFRFITAAKHAPRFERELEAAFFRSIEGRDKLPGLTFILIDVSGSMDWPLSSESKVCRVDAAAAVAIILRELCDDIRVFTFSNRVVEVPARRGFGLSDAIKGSQPHQGTKLGAAVSSLNGIGCDRLVVITDEQTCDTVPSPRGLGYLINVASNKNGVGYGDWLHIDGFSEAVVDYITAFEDNLN